jgi:hypothetical protein
MAQSNNATFTGAVGPGGAIHGNINFGSTPSTVERKQFQYFEGYKKSFKQMTGLGSGMSAIKAAFSSLFNALFDVIFAPLFPEIIKWIQLFVKFIALVREKGILGALGDMGFWREVWNLAYSQLSKAWGVFKRIVMPEFGKVWNSAKRILGPFFSNVASVLKEAFIVSVEYMAKILLAVGYNMGIAFINIVKNTIPGFNRLPDFGYIDISKIKVDTTALDRAVDRMTESVSDAARIISGRNVIASGPTGSLVVNRGYAGIPIPSWVPSS